MQTIGMVGLGAMGAPMARNLLARGFTVRGFDLRQEACQALGRDGGIAASSPADAAAGADALVLMVANAAQAEQVLFEAGALQALPPHAIVILTATCAPHTVQAMARRVAASGRGFLDCPVSGGIVGVRDGTLTLMAAGEEAVFRAAKPVLEAFGDKIFHLGPSPGQGAMVKTINQLLCGVHLVACAEALALADRLGMDGKAVLEIVGNSAASSWMLRNRGPRMLQTGPEVTSAVDIFVKDLGIVLEAGRDVKAALPMAAVAHQMFLAASGRGDGAADDSQVIGSYRRLNGPKARLPGP